jgi:hypothetical protein
MFDETYTRIRHQERLQEAEDARRVRTLERPNRSGQFAPEHLAARIGYNRSWRLPIRSASRRLAALIVSRADSKHARRPIALTDHPAGS